MTLNPLCDNVETKQGVPLTVTGVAQVKIMKDPALLEIAAEQFLGKKEECTFCSRMLAVKRGSDAGSEHETQSCN